MIEILLNAALKTIRKADSLGERLTAIIIVTGLSALCIWAFVHVEMYLYEKIIIDAMGANLNKIDFLQMLGLNVFVHLLFSKNNTSRGDE